MQESIEAIMRTVALVLAFLIAVPAGGQALPRPGIAPLVRPANVIDRVDDRDSLLAIGADLGLKPEEINRIRAVSGYVGCLSPSPSVGAGALFLTNDQILTAAHIFFEPSGRKRSKCFFKNQAAEPVMVDLLTDGGAIFGAEPPRAGSNSDYAVVLLAAPIKGAKPFPVDLATPVRNDDRLIVITAHPAGLDKELDKGVPVAQPCAVRRVAKSTGKTNFYRTDCDASGSSSGGMHLSRVDGRLVFRGITITTGLWREPKLYGAPYDEKSGSVTTALSTDAAILAAGRKLAGLD